MKRLSIVMLTLVAFSCGGTAELDDASASVSAELRADCWKKVFGDRPDPQTIQQKLPEFQKCIQENLPKPPQTPQVPADPGNGGNGGNGGNQNVSCSTTVNNTTCEVKKCVNGQCTTESYDVSNGRPCVCK
jgi:hypothetical protein